MKVFNWLIILLISVAIIVYAFTNRYEYISFSSGSSDFAYSMRIDNFRINPTCVVPYGLPRAAWFNHVDSEEEIKRAFGIHPWVDYCWDLIDISDELEN